MMARMAEALQAHAALMERYARAGYQIGKLETENKQLVAERETLAAKLADLEVRLADGRLNEQVLEAERDRALQRVDELTVRLAEAGIRPAGRWQAFSSFLRRHW
jgi:chromosome segregation ATPase